MLRIAVFLLSMILPGLAQVSSSTLTGLVMDPSQGRIAAAA